MDWKCSMKRKSFLLRLDPALYEAIEGLAAQELRSVNGQMEFLLRQAIQARGRHLPQPDDAGHRPAGETPLDKRE